MHKLCLFVKCLVLVLQRVAFLANAISMITHVMCHQMKMKTCNTDSYSINDLKSKNCAFPFLLHCLTEIMSQQFLTFFKSQTGLHLPYIRLLKPENNQS